MENHVAILVVIYNKKTDESSTLNTLSKYCLPNCDVLIHNNGPEVIFLSETLGNILKKNFGKVVLTNCLENKPLSILYNDFIHTNDKANKFVILDDDSTVTDSFIDSILDNSYDIQIPRIISRKDNLTYYPISSGKIVECDGVLNSNNTFSIGSGLVINSSVVNFFNKNKVDLFDENYALYGVDISFFRKIHKFSRAGDVFLIKTTSTLMHSLSRTEEVEESSFRKKERLIDFSISIRRYPSTRMYLRFLKRIFIDTINLRFYDVFSVIYFYILSKHPRCKSWNRE